MWQELVSNFVTLLVVIDPIGTLPVFLAVTGHCTPDQRRRVALRAILVAAGVLVGFIIAGQVLLRAMHIELPSFQIAGGIVLFLFGLQMIFSTDSPQPGVEHKHDVAVFPLAIPSIAGPGAMLAAVVLTDNDRHNIGDQAITTVLLLLVLALTYGMLLLANGIHRLIGDGGIHIVRRVMGLILCALAVETILEALDRFYQLGPQVPTG